MHAAKKMNDDNAYLGDKVGKAIPITFQLCDLKSVREFANKIKKDYPKDSTSMMLLQSEEDFIYSLTGLMGEASIYTWITNNSRLKPGSAPSSKP